MQALILAGGRGTRLEPYTTVVPKPLMPVGDMPILEIILRQLKRAGVDEVLMAVGYLGQLLQAFFGNGERLGLRIGYSMEDRPRGTAGPIALLADRLGDDFILMNGDLLTTLDYAATVAAHREAAADATIAIHTRQVHVDFGVVEPSPDGRLLRYTEKPTLSYDVSMGINVLRTAAVLPYVTRVDRLDVPELMVQMAADGLVVRCHRSSCFWLDIGRIDDQRAANEIFEQRRSEFLPEP